MSTILALKTIQKTWWVYVSCSNKHLLYRSSGHTTQQSSFGGIQVSGPRIEHSYHKIVLWRYHPQHLQSHEICHVELLTNFKVRVMSNLHFINVYQHSSHEERRVPVRHIIAKISVDVHWLLANEFILLVLRDIYILQATPNCKHLLFWEIIISILGGDLSCFLLVGVIGLGSSLSHCSELIVVC